MTFKESIAPHKLDKPIATRMCIGDLSCDGHGIYEDIYLAVNYPITDIQQAYKESCRATGVQFNHNENFVEPGKKNLYDQILTEYGNCYIRPNEVDILFEHGILTDEKMNKAGLFRQKHGIQICEAIELTKVIMYFIAYSMPDDFCYSIETVDYIPAINNSFDLSVQFGYGIYIN